MNEESSVLFETRKVCEKTKKLVESDICKTFGNTLVNLTVVSNDFPYVEKPLKFVCVL